MWARRASAAGIRVVGASSLPYDSARGSYPEWISLPWIGDGDFSSALGHCLADKRIDSVFTTHPVVWSTLRELLPKIAQNVRLESEQPWAAELAEYREYRNIAGRFSRQPLDLAASGSIAPPMSALQLAALVRTFELVPGQCDYQKIEALLTIFRRMPRGDIVEIGSLWGRSAVALAFLSRHYAIGNLLCVDPWGREELRQDIPAVDTLSDELPIEEVFAAFRINLAPFGGMVNYSRARSIDAASVYCAERCFTTEDFGRTTYSGQIALLHIDGNHALEAVRSDISAWQQFVIPGGWIVFDDYCWPFGDGPRIAADQFSLEFADNLEAAFVAGGALFVQVS